MIQNGSSSIVLPQRALVLHSAEVHRTSVGDGLRVRVKLERPSKGIYVGVAQVGSVPIGDMRCAAQAALQALAQAIGPERQITFELDDVDTFEAFGNAAVMVSLFATVDGQRRSLMGFSPLAGDAPTAAARAVLDATNRLLGNS